MSKAPGPIGFFHTCDNPCDHSGFVDELKRYFGRPSAPRARENGLANSKGILNRSNQERNTVARRRLNDFPWRIGAIVLAQPANVHLDRSVIEIHCDSEDLIVQRPMQSDEGPFRCAQLADLGITLLASPACNRGHFTGGISRRRCAKRSDPNDCPLACRTFANSRFAVRKSGQNIDPVSTDRDQLSLKHPDEFLSR